jgi:hypothetical protein
MAVTMSLKQSGSGSTKISAQSGDSISVALAATVESGPLAAAVAALQVFSGIAGVTFTVDSTGDAS